MRCTGCRENIIWTREFVSLLANTTTTMLCEAVDRSPFYTNNNSCIGDAAHLLHLCSNFEWAGGARTSDDVSRQFMELLPNSDSSRKNGWS